MGMSWETTQARAARDHAHRVLREHEHGCSQCAGARRYQVERCPEGSRLHTDAQASTRALNHERELDKQPAIGQGVLFGQEVLF